MDLFNKVFYTKTKFYSRIIHNKLDNSKEIELRKFYCHNCNTHLLFL